MHLVSNSRNLLNAEGRGRAVECQSYTERPDQPSGAGIVRSTQPSTTARVRDGQGEAFLPGTDLSGVEWR
jgi:hypothetical protein